MNSQTLLNLFLQKNIRQSVPFQYEKVTSPSSLCVQYQIRIGRAVFVGHPRQFTVDAKRSAAKEALAAISVFDNKEIELRKHLGLEPRVSLQQTDNIRDELRTIKQRARNLSVVSKSAVIHSIVDIYTIIDFIETTFAREDKSDS